MKLTKSKLQQLIKEELKVLIEANPEVAQALLGKAGVPKDEPENEAWVDIGQRGPNKEDLIKAAELLEIEPDNFRNQLVLYNIATLLKNRPDASPQLIVKAIRNAWEENELIGGDGALQEILRKLRYGRKR